MMFQANIRQPGGARKRRMQRLAGGGLAGAAAAALALAGAAAMARPEAQGRSRTLYHHTTTGPYTGTEDAVIVGDTRFGTSVCRSRRDGQKRIAYMGGAVTIRREAELGVDINNKWLALDELRANATEVCWVGRGTQPRGHAYGPQRIWYDGRHPAAILWMRHEAQRVVAGDFDAVFFDNTIMTPVRRGVIKLVETAPPGFDDEAHAASMAAAIGTFRDECRRLGRRLEMIVNVSDPWNWEQGGKLLNWRQGYPKVADYFAKLGVDGVMLELPEKRAAGGVERECLMEFGRLWLSKGGALYVIFEDAEAAAPLRAALDGPRTYMWVRPRS